MLQPKNNKLVHCCFNLEALKWNWTHQSGDFGACFAHRPAIFWVISTYHLQCVKISHDRCCLGSVLSSQTSKQGQQHKTEQTANITDYSNSLLSVVYFSKISPKTKSRILTPTCLAPVLARRFAVNLTLSNTCCLSGKLQRVEAEQPERKPLISPK